MPADQDPAIRRRARRDIAIIMSPLAVGVLLNAIVRPWLATFIDAEEIRRGTSVRGSNRWWEPTPQSVAEHPVISWFLSVSDGALAGVLLASCGLIAIAMWLCGRIARRRGERRRAATQTS
ncbi:hypothetical protein [Leucobacter chromiireducens]|uniref:Uncharacterized protein n=1 Tax=Leucobacter chromiireducens subsp. chromiireducens TaxID=660067 RepID=A0ABS1SQT0_9MICO|nr:hypothetical protein [Leucobacter chromiireducens]MBL3689241.1 hypothetical protein [Leucobacter chromiireducens subsp. chromiireducens]